MAIRWIEGEREVELVDDDALVKERIAVITKYADYTEVALYAFAGEDYSVKYILRSTDIEDVKNGVIDRLRARGEYLLAVARALS